MSAYKIIAAAAVITVLGVAGLAQDAKVPVEVSPPQAYVYLDGAAIRDGSHTLKTTPGEHVIAVYNYGYVGETRNVTLKKGLNPAQTFTLNPSGNPVPGEFGFIQIEGPSRAAVLLNGKTPEYHVGHVDEFNNHILGFQQLLVLPGTHEITVTRFGKTIWSGPVQVAAGERVILHVPSGDRRVQKVGNYKGPWPRFTAGTASAQVTIAPVAATLAATPQNINCNEKSTLAYSSTDALHTTMKDGGNTNKLPDLAGNMTVEPRHTTTYDFAASGPGGTVTQQATVNVNPVVQSTLQASPTTMNYLKVGNDVLIQDSGDVKWTTSNADAMSLSGAPVPASGEQSIKAEPEAKTGPVNETKTYTLTATNVCGGSETKTVQVATKGLIAPDVLSVFFPTAYPDKKNPDIGLLKCQQQRLMNLVNIFPVYAERVPDAKIVIHGYTDHRGNEKYNKELSERRVAITKNFLVAHGIPADKIVIDAMGETGLLDEATVQKLDAENPSKTAESAKLKPEAIHMAYNRRVDVELQPANLESARVYPYESPAANVLVEVKRPKVKALEQQPQGPTVASAGH
jgi:OmpA family